MVRDRFAPSPTGDVHVGSLRTALYNYLYAKQSGGDFILRLEDTDRTRLVESAVPTLLNALYTTGVYPDEGLILEDGEARQTGEYGPYIQSERLPIYKEYIKKLLDSGDAYYCFCSKERLDDLREKQRAAGETPRYDGHCRDLTPEEVKERIENGEEYVIRLKLPEDKTITFNDKIRGEIKINTDELDDQVLIKADGYPTYHFAVVVDDHEMGVTHVIRGEEWLSSTPKHVYLYDCFGWEAPEYVHLPNITNSEHKKLSKREGDVSVEAFLEKGYLPEALINYLALLGWSPKDNREIFSLEELIERFSLDDLSHSNAVFDIEKLNWMNSEYIKKMDITELTERLNDYLKDYTVTPALAALLQERISNFSEAPAEIEAIYSSDFEFTEPEVLEILEDERVPILINALIEKIENTEELSSESAQKILKEIQKENKEHKIKGKMLYMPTRIVLTGQMHGPDLTGIMEVLGKEEVLKRLKKAKEL